MYDKGSFWERLFLVVKIQNEKDCFNLIENLFKKSISLQKYSLERKIKFITLCFNFHLA